MIEYTYKGETDLIESQFIFDGDKICKRLFFEYDGYGNLIKKTVDDSPHRDKFEGATERHTTVMEYNHMGLPKEVKEFYLDLETGEDRLLSRVVNDDYTIMGKLKQQHQYDSQNDYCYTLNWDYDAHGNCTLEVNAKGEIVERLYDVNDNLIDEKKEGLHTTFDYDKGNRLKSFTQTVSGIPLTTSYQYDNCGNRTKIIDPFGHETDFTYDDFGRVIKTEGPFVCDEQGQISRPTTLIEYDVMNNPVLVTDPNNNKTATTYNILGKPLIITHADGTTESFQYKMDGVTLAHSTSKNGMITRYEYDAFGRLLFKRDYSPAEELLNEETFTYNSLHLLTSTDAAGCITTYTYDNAGRQISIEKGDSKTTFQYDTLGRISKTLNHYGFNESDVTITVQEYEELNRLIEERTEDHLNNVLRKVRYEYDNWGNRNKEIKYTQAGESITRTTYDELKRPLEIKDALGNITTYVYSPVEIGDKKKVLQTNVTDPLGNMTITLMNPLNRVACLTRKNSNGNVIAKKKLLYDNAGNQIKTIETVITPNTEDRDVITSWKYNSMNEISILIEALGTSLDKKTTIDYKESTGQKDFITKPNGIQILHEYDAKGRLKNYFASDHSFHYVYHYDLNDNPTVIEDKIANTKTTREYNKNGLMITETLGNDLTTTYIYDRTGRMKSQTLPDGTCVTYDYNAMHLTGVHRTAPDGTLFFSHGYTSHDLSGNVLESQLMRLAGKITYDYDLLGRPKEISHSAWSESIPNGGYDSVGNLICKTVLDVQGSANCNYTYDDLYQLTSESGIAPHTYQNDSINNRVNKDTKAYQVNALNQLTQETDYQYHYDANGNLDQKTHLSTKQVVEYSYDALDRLIAVVDYDSRYEYDYDSFNRRLSKTYFKREGSLWNKIWKVRYLYQGQNEIGLMDESERLMELRLLGKGKGAENGATIALEIARKMYIPIHDHNGNVVCLLNGWGRAEETYRYSAFGEEQFFDYSGDNLDRSTLNNPWRFSSKRVDPETGFVYFGRRFYDPRIGRWLAPDPLGFKAGPNLYAYVMNGPLTRFDLYGLFDHDISDVDFLSPCSYDDMRSVGDYGMAMGEYALDLCHGVGEAGIAMGELIYGDMQYEYCDDDTFFRNNCESTALGWQALGSSIKEDPVGTFFPGFMDACRMPSDTLLTDKIHAWGRATVDVGLIAYSVCKSAGVANGASRATNFSRQGLQTLTSGNRIANGIVVNQGIQYDLNVLSRAAAGTDRGPLTFAGRSLTKHGAGARSGNSLFPAARGSSSEINLQAQNIVDDILTTPDSSIQNSYRGRFGNTVEITSPGGRGIVFDSHGKFLFFKE